MRFSAVRAILVTGLFVGGCASAPAPQGLAPVRVVVRPSVPIAEFGGDPNQIGVEHGERFRAQINELYNNYLLVQLQGPNLVQARLAAASFEIFMSPQNRAEIQGLAQGAGLNVYDAALAQCFLDLLPVTGCSTISLPASASPDGVARFGRNLDFDSMNILDKKTVVIVYHPEGKYQFATIGWPGMIGAVSGMNKYGLCLANMEVPRGFRPPMATPYTLLYRDVLEQCRTVDEAVALLKRSGRQSANNLMLMDAAGNRAVAEIRPESVTVRWGRTDESLISTNHQRGLDFDTPGYCWRYDALHGESAKEMGKIDLPRLEQMLSTVVQGEGGKMTLESMIFEPANRVVYLATGADAPANGFERIDLRDYFSASGN
jgi:isopenicillin-N N-acyltransferase like protein